MNFLFKNFADYVFTTNATGLNLVSNDDDLFNNDMPGLDLSTEDNNVFTNDTLDL